MVKKSKTKKPAKKTVPKKKSGVRIKLSPQASSFGERMDWA
jgi:hypothetical protein